MMFKLYEIAGRDGYPREWHESIKQAVREAVGHRCIRCRHPYKKGQHGRGEWSACDALCTHLGPLRLGPDATVVGIDELSEMHKRTAGAIVAEGRSVQAQWRILTVHHFDENKMNCRWWNLGALCQRCHLSVQGRVKMRRPYFLEHTEWFRPYVAGFYAFTYLGQDLGREEVESRLDELLRFGAAAKQVLSTKESRDLL